MMLWGDIMKITTQEIALNEIISVFDGALLSGKGGKDGREHEGFVLVLGGQALYEFEDQSFLVNPGDVLYLPRGSAYRITVTEQLFRWACVDFRFERPESLEPALFHLSGKAMENAFSKLRRLWRLGDFSEKLLCKAIFYEIYAALIRAEATESLASDQGQRLQEAVAYIHSHYKDPALSVEQLAEIYGSSAVHFRRTFAKLYRTSPLKYITALRLSKARELLQSTDLPVGDICAQCGYTSLYYFDRVFKTTFGMQPLQFRKQSLL